MFSCVFEGTSTLRPDRGGVQKTQEGTRASYGRGAALLTGNPHFLYGIGALNCIGVVDGLKDTGENFPLAHTSSQARANPQVLGVVRVLILYALWISTACQEAKLTRQCQRLKRYEDYLKWCGSSTDYQGDDANDLLKRYTIRSLAE